MKRSRVLSAAMSVALVAGIGLGAMGSTATAAPADKTDDAPGVPPSEATSSPDGDQYIVLVDDRATLSRLSAGLAEEHVAVGSTLDGEILGFTAELTEAEAAALRGRRGVRTVERDHVLTLTGTQHDPPWGLDRIDQRSPDLNSRYSYGYTGAGVRAYVIDSGIRPSHTDFAGRIGPGWSFDGGGVQDCNGHGTHVSGTVGGTQWGVAKRVTISPVKVFGCNGSTTTSVVIAGINWAIGNHPAGAPAVANMSLGGPASSALDDAVRAMINDGITVVVAAGNEAQPTCNVSPARVPPAITVAASTIDDDDAWFSNYGACNDLFAPGVDIESAAHDSNNGSRLLSGTSMASPHVAGAAALVLDRNPSATPARVWQIIDAATTRGALSECCGDPDKLLYVSPGGPAVTRPGTPRRLQAAVAPARGVGSGQVRLAWQAPLSNGGAPITDYVVRRSANRGRSWTVVRDGVSTARSVLVRRLRNGQRYLFQVAAKNRVGAGTWARPVAAVPATRPGAPRALDATVAPERGSGQVRLAWRAPLSNGGAPVTDYVVRRSGNGGRSWTVVRDGVSTARSVTVRGLVNGHRYLFQVAAKNRVGAGPWTRPVAAVPRRR
jgi:subtilisin family serine protease